MHAFRSFTKSPGFTVVAILTLALGIGATTTIYSVVNAVLLKPLNYPHPEQLVSVYETDGADRKPGGGSVSPVTYQDWRTQAKSFAHLAAYRGDSLNLTGAHEPRRLSTVRTTAEYWDTFGVPPLLGRGYTTEEDRPGAAPVVVLSHAFWQQEFGASPAILGQAVQLNGRPVTVIGVMPATFQSTAPTDLWTPLAFEARELAEPNRGAHYINVVGRLRTGASIEQTRSEIDVITAQIARDHPNTNRNGSALTLTLLDASVGEQRLTLYTLLGAVVALLLIACVNIANLLLARATGRLREFSVRAALGASPRRIICQLLGESLLLALVGGGLGVVFSFWSLDAIIAVAPPGFPRLRDSHVDLMVLGASSATILLCGLGFGLVPALQGARTNLVDALKDGARGTGDRASSSRVRSALVVAEVGIALALLMVAALLMRSFTRLVSADPGFDPRNTISVRLTLSSAQYDTAEKRVAFANELTRRVRALSGVTAVGVAQSLPFSGSEWVHGSSVEGRPPQREADQRPVEFYAVDDGYFAAMGIAVTRGRAFTSQDRMGSAPVVIVSQTYAKAEFPDGDALGRRITISNTRQPVWREIVGIVRDVKHNSLDAPPQSQVYEPFAQRSNNYINLVVRMTNVPTDVTTLLKQEIYSLDANQPVTRITPLVDLVVGSTGRQRFLVLLLGIFSVLALFLSAIGVYGVVAYDVAQRATEYGVRLALGATPADVLRLVMVRSGKLIGGGLVLGLALGSAASQLLHSQLYATPTYDPLAVLGVAALLALIGLVACFIPGFRATRVNPITALRAE